MDAEVTVPEIVQVVEDTYHLAQRWRYPSFALSEDPDGAAASEERRVVLLTMFRKTRVQETAEVERAHRAQKECETRARPCPGRV